MKVITLEKTKELLGIATIDTSKDAAITANIPMIDAKIKQITNNRFNQMIIGDITLNSPYIPVSSVYTNGQRCDYLYRNGLCGYYGDGINNPYQYDSIGEYLEVGQLVSGSGIPDGTYIEEVFYNGDVYSDGVTEFSVPVIQLSANATATGGAVRIYLGINIAYQSTIAKGIQYLINSTSAVLPGNSISSKSMLGVSVAYGSADQQMDNKYGMPAWFVKSFPQYQGGH